MTVTCQSPIRKHTGVTSYRDIAAGDILWNTRSLLPFAKMLESLYSIPFAILEVPNLRVRVPSWFRQPSAMTMFSMVLLSYFLVTGGLNIIWFIQWAIFDIKLSLKESSMTWLWNPQVLVRRQTNTVTRGRSPSCHIVSMDSTSWKA